MKIETKRLILRKPKTSDWKDLIEGVGDFEVSRNTLKIPHPYSKKDALWWLNDAIKRWGKESYSFLIELKETGKVIGCIDLIDVDKFIGKAETGSWINKKYWRRGYITEAKIAANNFAFDDLGLRKLDSSIFTDNVASNKTQQRAGYKYEGCRKKDARSKATGEIKDVNLYGLFKEDWKKNLPKLNRILEDKIKKLK